jgi:hypothetical protein
MSLLLVADLKAAKTEEDIKDAYVKALGLSAYSKNLVDIQTKDIWFEAKVSGVSAAAMFAQLLIYVKMAHVKGERLPPFLAVIDRDKAALMETARAMPLLADTAVEWPKSASSVQSKTKASTDFIKAVESYVSTHFIVYNVQKQSAGFIHAVKTAIAAGRFIRTAITPANLKRVFDHWVEMIGRELDGVDEPDYALLFFADVMHDGERAAMSDLPARLLQDGGKPVFLLRGKDYGLANDNGYRRFWAMYDRPPEQRHRSYLLERRDSLLPLDERAFKGAFYTPLKVVEKAYELLDQTLGPNWQEDYIVWDMCCGVGNLEVKHSNHRNVFMSTLDQADIDVMRASRICVAATKFQYDYLNDDITDAGEIDYSLTNKVPMALRQAIGDAKAGKPGAKKILVLMNPPYAEAGNALGNLSKSKVSMTRIARRMSDAYGSATNELFVQFMARASYELIDSKLAMFSKLKHINASNFELFREVWQATFLAGFVVPSKVFEGLKGNFPIGFLLWDTKDKAPISETVVKILDADLYQLGVKRFAPTPSDKHLNKWIDRPRQNSEIAIPLKNSFSPYDKPASLTRWSQNAIGYMWCQNNDLQHSSQQTNLFSSVWGDGHGFYLIPDNLWQAAIVFSVRRLIKPTWLNDRDQFLQPSEPLTDTFKTDCLIWMLFNGSNLSAGADGLEWNGRTWSLTNHFVPFTEDEVGARERFESNFMSDYLRGRELSAEAEAVLDEGRHLWRAYHATTMSRSIRDAFKLGRPDAGWYQIRKALEANAENQAVDFSEFKAAYAKLSDKLRPMVYTLGFLKE